MNDISTETCDRQQRSLVAQVLGGAKLAVSDKPWIRVQDAIPERMSDGIQISREVQVLDSTGDLTPRTSCLHYYDNQPSFWDEGSPTHWRELPDQPNER